MTHPIPDDTLARWRKLAEEATTGPWKRDGFSVIRAVPEEGDPENRFGTIARFQLTTMNAQSEWRNADFTAEARSALPALLDEVARLREENRRLEEERDEAKRDAESQKRRAAANFDDFARMRDHANEVARKADADSGRAGAEIRRLEEAMRQIEPLAFRARREAIFAHDAISEITRPRSLKSPQKPPEGPASAS